MGIKVGGHQASSASVASILTSLFFDFMRAGDQVAVKPHASPALHACQYLLGNLDRRYLTEHRAFQVGLGQVRGLAEELVEAQAPR